MFKVNTVAIVCVKPEGTGIEVTGHFAKRAPEAQVLNIARLWIFRPDDVVAVPVPND